MQGGHPVYFHAVKNTDTTTALIILILKKTMPLIKDDNTNDKKQIIIMMSGMRTLLEVVCTSQRKHKAKYASISIALSLFSVSFSGARLLNSSF
jgi:hypothetical protein